MGPGVLAMGAWAPIPMASSSPSHAAASKAAQFIPVEFHARLLQMPTQRRSRLATWTPAMKTSPLL